MKYIARHILRIVLCFAVPLCLSIFLTACEGEDEGTETVVVVPSSDGGDPDGEADETEETQETEETDDTEAVDEGDGVQAVISAPQLVSPRNGRVFGYAGEDVPIAFEWTAVPNARSYTVLIVREFGGSVSVQGTTHQRSCGEGTWTWSVSAVDANASPGPRSAIWSFSVESPQPVSD